MFKLLNTSVSVRIEDELNDIETSHSAFWVNIVSKYTSITIRSKYTSFEIEVYFDRSILLLYWPRLFGLGGPTLWSC